MKRTNRLEIKELDNPNLDVVLEVAERHLNLRLAHLGLNSGISVVNVHLNGDDGKLSTGGRLGHLEQVFRHLNLNANFSSGNLHIALGDLYFNDIVLGDLAFGNCVLDEG